MVRKIGSTAKKHRKWARRRGKIEERNEKEQKQRDACNKLFFDAEHIKKVFGIIQTHTECDSSSHTHTNVGIPIIYHTHMYVYLHTDFSIECYEPPTCFLVYVPLHALLLFLFFALRHYYYTHFSRFYIFIVVAFYASSVHLHAWACHYGQIFRCCCSAFDSHTSFFHALSTFLRPLCLSDKDGQNITCKHFRSLQHQHRHAWQRPTENSISMRCQTSNFPERCSGESWKLLDVSLVCTVHVRERVRAFPSQFIFLIHINKSPELSKHQQISQLHMFSLWNCYNDGGEKSKNTINTMANGVNSILSISD